MTRSIFIDDNDRAAFREMIDKYGITFDTQTTPSGTDGSVQVDIKNYL